MTCGHAVLILQKYYPNNSACFSMIYHQNMISNPNDVIIKSRIYVADETSLNSSNNGFPLVVEIQNLWPFVYFGISTSKYDLKLDDSTGSSAASYVIFPILQLTNYE
jgi:hypothetical protein